MRKQLSPQDTPLLGLASGLAAGAVGSAVMTAFQNVLAKLKITSGVSGAPSTEKAADWLSRTTTGRKLPRGKRPDAGEAVHYGFGSLIGGAYGLAADLSPRVTIGQGSAFGVAAATVVDETLVPAFGLGDPFWKAPAISHPYSYASHVVFGVSTEAARQFFRRFLGEVQAGVAVVKNDAPRPVLATEGPARWRTLGLAFMLGATAGPRTTAPLLATTWAARLGWLDLKGTRMGFLATPKAAWVVTPMALGELVADKLPSTPDRTEPVGVIARATTGALSGAALTGGRSGQAVLAGAAGALAATYVGHRLRTRMSKSLGRDWPVAGAEDILAIGGALMVCLAALAPADKGADTRVKTGAGLAHRRTI